jgi:putative endonuclease
MKVGFVYIHKAGVGSIFTSKYKLHELVYFERIFDIEQAIRREKQLKRWHRDWKINLIKSINPEMIDLSNIGLPADAEINSA